MLGPVELIDGISSVRLPRAERILLAALAARVGDRVAVETLEEALWSENRPPSARRSVQAHIVHLRRALGSQAIVERAGGYWLDPVHVEVDAERVVRLVDEAREAIRRGDHGLAVSLLDGARGAFRGQPYEGVPDSAVPTGEVQRLEELRVSIAEDVAEAEIARGRGHCCVGDLEAFVLAYPYRERAWGLLMRALYQAGRPADALAAYGRARVLLAAELGIEPGPALRQVEQAILDHDASLLMNEATRAVLGASNVPAAVSPIVGRELELVALTAVGQADRLLTLTGAGGIGKTRLAVEVATQSVGHYQFGPFFVDLSPLGAVDLVAAAVAAALHVTVEPGADVMAVVRKALGQDQVLIVFDNCEHLLPGIAELVASLLASSPNTRVMATSREPLGIAGERVCPVDPLRVPPDAASIDEIENSDAGALFLSRLPMNLATASLSPDDLAAVGTICRLLEGIPLGLELAAALSRTLSLPELAVRLRRSINELAPPRHGVTARHRTMRAALDWGYELISPTAQKALTAMSVFGGGCDFSAFATLCVDSPDSSTVDVLEELVRTSFVLVDHARGPTRYRLLEPVRQYARELLEAHEAAIRQRRHLQYYLEVARSMTQDVDRFGFETKWDDLRPELGNFRAALDWASRDRDSVDDGLWLVARLWDLWMTDAHHDEGLTRTIDLLNSGAGSTAAQVTAAYAAGFIASEIGDDNHGVRLWNQALQDAQAGNDKLGEMRVRRVLCTCALIEGDVEQARRHINTAIRMALEEGQDLLHSHCLIELSQLYHAMGELDQAVELIREVLDGPTSSDETVQGCAHDKLAYVLFDRGDYDGAIASSSRELSLYEQHSTPHFTMRARLRLAEAYCAAGNIDAAAAQLQAAQQVALELPAGWDIGLLSAAASVALLRQQPAEALEFAEHVAKLGRESNNLTHQCGALNLLGHAQLAADEPATALTTFHQVLARAAIAPYPTHQADGHEGAAAAYTALNRHEEAVQHLRVATQIRLRTRSQRIPRPVTEQLLARLGPLAITY